MPLYDFTCNGCGLTSTLLLKYDDPATCPACGGMKMERQLAPCSFTGLAPRPTATASRGPTPAPHTHSSSCGCAPGAKSAPQPCATEARADALIKKYLD